MENSCCAPSLPSSILRNHLSLTRRVAGKREIVYISHTKLAINIKGISILLEKTGKSLFHAYGSTSAPFIALLVLYKDNFRLLVTNTNRHPTDFQDALQGKYQRALTITLSLFYVDVEQYKSPHSYY
jgi:hypothetical protein